MALHDIYLKYGELSQAPHIEPQRIVALLKQVEEALLDFQLGEDDKGAETMQSIHNVLKWDFDRKVKQLGAILQKKEMKKLDKKDKNWWDKTCKASYSSDWCPDATLHLAASAEPLVDTGNHRIPSDLSSLVERFVKCPDDEKVDFFLDIFHPSYLAAVQTPTTTLMDKLPEIDADTNSEELARVAAELQQAHEQYHQVLVKTAVVMADCIHLPSSNAKRRLFGCRWDEKSVDFLKSRSKQLSRLFHPDKVTSWAHRLHLVAPDLSCFVQAQAALNKHKGISERKKTVRELELSAENWWRQAKAFDEKIAEGEHCKMKDLIQQRRQASREARLVWTEMLRVLDESAAHGDGSCHQGHQERIRVRCQISEACCLEDSPPAVSQLYLLGALRLVHDTWPLTDTKAAEKYHDLVMEIRRLEEKTTRSRKQAQPSPTECQHSKSGSATDIEVLPMVQLDTRGIGNDFRVETKKDLLNLFQRTTECDLDAYQLLAPTLDLQLCSPDASTNAWLQLKHAADTKKTGFCSAVAFAAGVGKCGLGWSFGSALCGGLGIVAIAGGATFFTANYLMSSRQEKRRKAFLQHFYDLLQECDRKSQSEGVEGFLKLLCSPVQNYKELGMAKDRIFHYPYCREKPLHDIESSVDQLLDLQVSPVFVGQLVLKVAEILASKRIKSMTFENGTVQQPIYSWMKTQAACIFKNVEEWTSEGGKLHQAAEKMDKFVSEHRWTQSKVKGTSTIVIDKSQTHYIEECFQVVDQSYLKVIKDLPQHLASTGGEKGMFMTSGVQLCSDGSKKPFEETEFKHVKEVVSLLTEPGVQKLEIHLRRSWSDHAQELFQFFCASSMNLEGSQKDEIREVALIAKINQAMLLLLNQNGSGEDGSIGAAEALLLEVLAEIRSLETPEQLEVRVSAVKDFFQVFSGRQLKMIEDIPDVNSMRVKYESWTADGKAVIVRVAWSVLSKENPSHSLVDAFRIALGKGLENPNTELLEEVNRLSPDPDAALKYLMLKFGVNSVNMFELPSSWIEYAKEMKLKPLPKKRTVTNGEVGGMEKAAKLELLKDGQMQWHAVQVFDQFSYTDSLAKAAKVMDDDLCTLGKRYCHIDEPVFTDLKSAADRMKRKGSERSDEERRYRSSLNAIYKLCEHFTKDYADNLRQYLDTELALGGHRAITDVILKDTSLFLKSPEIYSKLYLTKAHAFLVQGLLSLSQACTGLVEKRRESVPSTPEEDDWLERIKVCQAKAIKQKEEPSYYDQPEEWAHGKWAPGSNMGERCESKQPIYTCASGVDSWKLSGDSRITRYILSVDGGGMKGIIPGVIASEIELRIGAPLSQVFDLFAGTSTGALFAGGLNIPRTFRSGQEHIPCFTASDIVQQYVFQGHTLFKTPTASGLAMQSLYSPHGIEAYLKKLTQVDEEPMRLSDALSNLMICATKQGQRGPELVQWVARDIQGWQTLKLFDAMRASTAAPAYFPPHDIHGDVYADGALKANNPTKQAFEWMKKRPPVHAHEDLFVLSLGCGLSPSATFDHSPLYWASPKGAAEMFSLCDTTEAVHKEMLQISAANSGLTYYRCNPILPRHFDLADTSGEGIAAMLDVAETFLQDAYASESNWFNKMIEKLGESIATVE